MILSHYSNQMFGQVKSVEQPIGAMPYAKPRGLWVSVDGPDDWPSWCLRENFMTDTLVHRFEVTLSSNQRVLHLSNSKALMSFTEAFGLDTRYGLAIDWQAVAEVYDGLIIAPYQWSHRLNTKASTWYYGWDCASGCIWNAQAIAQIKYSPLLRLTTSHKET